MSEPRANEALTLLADYVEAYWRRDEEEVAFRNVPVGSADLARALAAESSAQDALITLNPAHLRTLAAALASAPEATP